MFNIQTSVFTWVKQCFGIKVAHSPQERRERFMEECLEAAQAAGMTKDSVLRLTDYVYSRPVGELSQEVAGVSITLDAMAAAAGINRVEVTEQELTRCYQKIDAIREKQLLKPRVSQDNTDYPDREWQWLSTDAAKWRVRGEEDPHGDIYTRGRETLCGGHLTDDELANAVYLEPDIATLTSAKERLRWLSRRCVALEAALK